MQRRTSRNCSPTPHANAPGPSPHLVARAHTRASRSTNHRPALSPNDRSPPNPPGLYERFLAGLRPGPRELQPGLSEELRGHERRSGASSEHRSHDYAAHVNWWRERSPWLLPALVTVLVAALGVATAIATTVTSWVAWTAVGGLTLAIAAATAVSERRRASSPQACTAIHTASPGSTVSQTYGLVLRREETITTADGSRTMVTEYFSEELAVRSLREDSVSTGRPLA
jgi:hypothetical protein